MGVSFLKDPDHGGVLMQHRGHEAQETVFFRYYFKSFKKVGCDAHSLIILPDDKRHFRPFRVVHGVGSDGDDLLVSAALNEADNGDVFAVIDARPLPLDDLVGKVRANPALYILQRRFDHQVDLMGLHTEFRPFSLAQVNWDDSTEKSGVVSTLDEIYGRGANGNDMANIIPRAGQASGFNLPVRRASELSSKCAQHASLFLKAM